MRKGSWMYFLLFTAAFFFLFVAGGLSGRLLSAMLTPQASCNFTKYSDLSPYPTRTHFNRFTIVLQEWVSEQSINVVCTNCTSVSYGLTTVQYTSFVDCSSIYFVKAVVKQLKWVF